MVIVSFACLPMRPYNRKLSSAAKDHRQRHGVTETHAREQVAIEVTRHRVSAFDIEPGRSRASALT